jgi:hypothetical protein
MIGFITKWYFQPLGADAYSKYEQQDANLLPPTANDFEFSIADADNEYQFSIADVDNQFDLSL